MDGPVLASLQEAATNHTSDVGVRDVFGASGFRRLLAVRFSGQFSDGLVQASLATYVLFSPERAASPSKVAVSFAIVLLPYSLVGPFAGVMLDRWRRRQVLVGANLLRAFLVAVLALIVVRGGQGPDLAIMVLVVLGLNRFILAALSAGTPHVVPARYLITANAIAPTAGTAATVIGALAGVVLRELAGGGDRASMIVLVVAAGTYVVAGLLAFRLHGDQLGPDVTANRTSIPDAMAGLAEGVRSLRGRPRARRAIALVCSQRVTFGMAVALAVLQARGALHPASDADGALRLLTVVIGLAGAGALAGALLAPRLAHRFGTVTWSAGAMAAGVCAGAISVSTVSWPGLLLMGFFGGFGGQSARVCTDSIVQVEIDDEHLGRVFSLYDMAVNVAMVTGLAYAVLVAGADGHSWVVPATMAIVALATAAFSIRADAREHRVSTPAPAS